MEIYVAAFPTLTEKRQASNGGGSQALWRNRLYRAGVHRGNRDMREGLLTRAEPDSASNCQPAGAGDADGLFQRHVLRTLAFLASRHHTAVHDHFEPMERNVAAGSTPAPATSPSRLRHASAQSDKLLYKGSPKSARRT